MNKKGIEICLLDVVHLYFLFNDAHQIFGMPIGQKINSKIDVFENI